jgi:PadR family transcriptional regulator PadR
MFCSLEVISARRHLVGKKVTITYPTAAILQALAGGYRYGFDIMDVSGLPSGTVYPALRRLEQTGLVTSSWEDAEIAQGELRPPRRYYLLTALGDEALQQATTRYCLLEGLAPALRKKDLTEG